LSLSLARPILRVLEAARYLFARTIEPPSLEVAIDSMHAQFQVSNSFAQPVNNLWMNPRKFVESLIFRLIAPDRYPVCRLRANAAFSGNRKHALSGPQ